MGQREKDYSWWLCKCVREAEPWRNENKKEEVGFRSRPVSLFFFYFPSPLKKDQQLQERLHLTTIRNCGACDDKKIADSCPKPVLNRRSSRRRSLTGPSWVSSRPRIEPGPFKETSERKKEEVFLVSSNICWIRNYPPEDKRINGSVANKTRNKQHRGQQSSWSLSS